MQFSLSMLAFTALIASSVLLNGSFPLSRPRDNWLAVAILIPSQIVVASTVLSELHAIGLPGFALCHLTLFFLGLALWARRGRQKLISLYLPGYDQVKSFIKQNAFLVAFVFVLSLVLVVLVLPTSFTPGDSAHYHLPRAHYWIQNRTARHFHTDDIRQIERPPNSSFLYMWEILITGSYIGLHVLQWLAAAMTALAIAAVARSAGHSRGAAILGSVVYLSLPSVVLQMSTPLNDLLTAFSTVVFIYFTLEGAVLDTEPDACARYRYLPYAGIAFGLMAGTKHISLLPLPALAAIFVVLLLLRFQDSIGAISRLGLYCLAGFVLLGSYNYVLNTVDFGRPITSARVPDLPLFGARAEEGISARDGARSPAANIVRYTYQVMDWEIVQPIPGADTLFVINNSVYYGIDEILDLSLEAAPGFEIGEFGIRRIRPGEIGFGPLGYMVLLTSPFGLAVMLARVRHARKYSTSLILLTLALGSFIVLSIVRGWTPAQARYLTLVLALMISAVVPFIYSRRRIALLWLVPIASLAIWTATRTYAASAQFAEQERSLAPWQSTILENSLPQDAHFGVAGRVEFIHMLRRFPGYRFAPIARNEIGPRLLDGRLDAALVLDAEDTFHKFRLPLEHDQSLLVSDPNRILQKNLDLYGVRVASSNGQPVLHIERSGLVRRLGPDRVQIFIPTVGPIAKRSQLVLRITFPVTAPVSEVLTLVCEGAELDLLTRNSMLIAQVPPHLFGSDQPYQLCNLLITDLEFGGKIPSDTIGVHVYPDTIYRMPTTGTLSIAGRDPD